MPELILLCGQEEFVCTAISVKNYRRYTEIMEHNNDASIMDAYEANKQIMKEVFGVTSRKIDQADPEDVLTAAKAIHFMMQDVITPKFLELNPKPLEKVEQEKSAFDEYDEENGYNNVDNQESLWKICRDNVDKVIKLCIQRMRASYQECMEADIISLLEHVAFELREIKK